MTEFQKLQNEFLEDHRMMIRCLVEVTNAVERGDLATARECADALDCAAGPHIEFEEHWFYPALRERLGPGFVDGLYEEHTAGRQALVTLLSATELDAEAVSLVSEQLRGMLAHAHSCGTLISHLRAFSEDEMSRLSQRLDQTRERARRWTQLDQPISPGG